MQGMSSEGQLSNLVSLKLLGKSLLQVYIIYCTCRSVSRYVAFCSANCASFSAQYSAYCDSHVASTSDGSSRCSSWCFAFTVAAAGTE
jgi:hypothetical protein